MNRSAGRGGVAEITGFSDVEDRRASVSAGRRGVGAGPRPVRPRAERAAVTPLRGASREGVFLSVVGAVAPVRRVAVRRPGGDGTGTGSITGSITGPVTGSVRFVAGAGDGPVAGSVARSVPGSAAGSVACSAALSVAGSAAGSVAGSATVPMVRDAGSDAGQALGSVGVLGAAAVGDRTTARVLVLPRRPAVRCEGSVRPVSARRYAVRRAVAAVVLGILAMLVVVALGLVAEAAGTAQARAGVPEGTAVVAVEPGETVWEIARRAVPEAPTTAVVERIVADNGLTGPVDSVLPAGLALRVPAA